MTRFLDWIAAWCMRGADLLIKRGKYEEAHHSCFVCKRPTDYYCAVGKHWECGPHICAENLARIRAE